MKNVTNIKKSYPPAFKTKVAMEMIRAEKTVAEICKENSIHPTQAVKWKKQAIELMTESFNHNKKAKEKIGEKEELIDKLYKELGQRTIELEWLKKKLGITS